MYSRQRGVTFLGWVFLILPIAIVVYAGIRVAPVYLNYLKVARALDQTATAFKSEENVSLDTIRTSIDRHFEIDTVDYPDIKDVTFQKAGHTWTIEAKYEDTAPLFGNLSLLVAFDKVVKIGGG